LTIDDLINELEKYYGEYENKYLKGSVKAYLLKDFKQENYPEVRKSIQYYHKVNFGVPCIATIEECIKLARAEKELNKREGVHTKNKWNYKEQAETNHDFDKVNIDLMSQVKIKRV